MTKKKIISTELGGDITNGANSTIANCFPYVIEASLKGTCPILFHRWNSESIAEKAKAAKGSDIKKCDNVESYVYRNDRHEICIPGEYIRGAIIAAAKFEQDPRSPRKSAMDLFRSGIIAISGLCSLGKDRWDFEDQRRVVIQRSGVTRTRPAMKEGWECKCQLLVNLPEYISEALLHKMLVNAGRLIGLADFRPTYGRFAVTRFERLELK